MKMLSIADSPSLLVVALAIAGLVLMPVLPATAQQGNPDTTTPSGGEFPEGWSARVDGDASIDEVVFKEMGDGLHATTGPAAVFYNPDWTHSGDYEVSASLTQTTEPEHPEAYGITIGGSNLEGDDQAYSYFLVRKTGEYFIATRDGEERNVIVNWTDHEAVSEQDEDGRQTNVLGVEVEGDDVIFKVNGTEVDRRQRGEILADGLFGFRINHRLDVHIDDLKR